MDTYRSLRIVDVLRKFEEFDEFLPLQFSILEESLGKVIHRLVSEHDELVLVPRRKRGKSSAHDNQVHFFRSVAEHEILLQPVHDLEIRIVEIPDRSSCCRLLSCIRLRHVAKDRAAASGAIGAGSMRALARLGEDRDGRNSRDGALQLGQKKRTEKLHFLFWRVDEELVVCWNFTEAVFPAQLQLGLRKLLLRRPLLPDDADKLLIVAHTPGKPQAFINLQLW